MRNFALLTPVLAVLGVPTPAVAQLGRWQEPEFDLTDCATNATHILVVNAEGRVTEVWKGNAAPGDLIPIDKFNGSALLRMKLATPTQSAPELSLEDYWWNGPLSWPLGCERMILFLVKSDRHDAATRYLGGWLPATRTGWFASSIARVDLFGGVRVQPRPWVANMPPSGFWGSEADFKQRVLLVMSGPVGCGLGWWH